MATATNSSHVDERTHNTACVQACIRCAEACEQCATACLGEHDVAMMANCIRQDRDCAEICWLAAAWLSRGSKHAREIVAVCAEVCQACANECSEHSAEHCQRCATICRECSDCCLQYANTVSSH